MAAVILNSANFTEFTSQTDKTVLVDFYADWCGPCQMLGPELEAIAEAHPETALGKLNVDENLPIALKFGISAIPVVQIWKNGEKVNEFIGYRDRAEIETLL